MTREEFEQYAKENGLVVWSKEQSERAIKALEQEPTSKNDSEVDCISRQAVIDELKRYFHDEYYQRTSIQDCRDCFIKDVLNHLPSVTPQEPKQGHWIWCFDSHKCSNCEEYTCFSDKNIPKYCPNCGARMSEVEQ